MKRKIGFLLLLCALMLLMLCGTALAEGFYLDEQATIAGMNYLPWARGYEPTSDSQNVTVCLPIRSEAAVGKIRAELTVDDESVSPLRGTGVSAEFLPDQKGLYAVKLTAPLLSGRINGDYAATVHVTGQDADGQALDMDFPVVLRVRDGQSAILQPPQLNNVSSGLCAGEDGVLTATLTNTDPHAEMTDILLTVSDSSGEVLPSLTDTLRVGALMPGESIEISYPLSVASSARVADHLLTVTVRYQALGAAQSWTETLTVPVTQEIRLERGALTSTASVVQGDQAAVTLPLMNMGRGTVNNVLATLSVPGLCESQSVLVGSIAPGETATARLNFTAKSEPGTYSGTLLISCEDAWGNGDQQELAISFDVEAPVVSYESSSPSDDAPAAQSSLLVWILAGACACLFIALLLTASLLVRKIHRLEEDKL